MNMASNWLDKPLKLVGKKGRQTLIHVVTDPKTAALMGGGRGRIGGISWHGRVPSNKSFQ